MAVTIKINTVFKSEAERMKEKDLEGKIVVGEFANKTKAEFTGNIQNLSERLSGDKTLINSAYRADL